MLVSFCSITGEEDPATLSNEVDTGGDNIAVLTEVLPMLKDTKPEDEILTAKCALRLTERVFKKTMEDPKSEDFKAVATEVEAGVRR